MLDHEGNVISGKQLDADAIWVGLTVLTRQVADTWKATDYPKNMQSDEAQFRHACVHATKVVGKISALIDHADHDSLASDEAKSLRAELPKLLADLIRCAAKMAETAPYGPVPLPAAYVQRMNQLADRWGH